MADLFTAPKPIATAGDLVIRLCQLFPRYVDELTPWQASYARVLGHLPPDKLTEVFHRVLDGWSKASPPRPADFAAHIPQAPQQPQQREDWHGRGRQAASLHQRQRRMADAAMRDYEAEIEHQAARYRDDASVYRDCIRYEIDREAEAATFGTVRAEPTNAQAVQLEQRHWESAHQRTETRLRARPAQGLGRAIRAAIVKQRPACLEEPQPEQHEAMI